MRWPLQPLQPLQKNTTPTTFQSISGFALCITATNLSYRFPILKLPPPPCAVLLVSILFRTNGWWHQQIKIWTTSEDIKVSDCMPLKIWSYVINAPFARVLERIEVRHNQSLDKETWEGVVSYTKREQPSTVCMDKTALYKGWPCKNAFLCFPATTFLQQTNLVWQCDVWVCLWIKLAKTHFPNLQSPPEIMGTLQLIYFKTTPNMLSFDQKLCINNLVLRV